MIKKERINFLGDILTTAVEGGINYWADTKNYSIKVWKNPNGDLHEVSVDVREWGEDRWYNLSATTISLGIDIIKDDKNFKINDTILGDILVGGASY